MAEFDLFKEVDAAWHRLTQYPGSDYDKPSFRMGFEACAELLGKLGWHPASEKPVIPEGESTIQVIAMWEFSSMPIKALCGKHGWVTEGVKWWCYPPQND